MTAYYSDIDIELTKANNGDITKDIDTNAIKNSLKNILNTFQGSRRMLPTFAFNAYQLLFEPIDEITAHQIGELMLEGIQDWDDRVIIEDIYVIPKYDDNQYKIKLNFRLKNSNKTTQELDYILTKI